jgi:signal transduction histidine kinase
MNDLLRTTSELPTPPWRVLRSQLADRAAQLADAGDVTGAAVLRTLIESWWREQLQWDAAVRELLRANHEINNALVGVSGNAQLLMLGPVGQQPKIRERLQTVLRESERIERAAQRLQALKTSLAQGEPDGLDTSHAA